MDELTNALKLIQKECYKYDSCSECPMGTDSGMCHLNGRNPVDWKIIEPKEIIRVVEE